MEWKSRFEREIQMARQARERGKEGQARVCARRAAGLAVQAYFQANALPVHSASAYDLIQELLTLPGLADDTRQAAGYLVLRVTEDFVLPAEGVDLVEVALQLARSLLPDAFQ
jgi:hypothetical protein